MREKINLLFFVIALIQVLLLANMVTAESYILGESLGKINLDSLGEDSVNKNLGKGLGILVGLFSIKQIGIVSAVDLQSCCVRGNIGTCQNFVEGEDVSCDDSRSTACANVAECQMGCCVNNDGTCDANAPEFSCDEAEGEWKPDSQCNVRECKLGCCVLQNGASFVTNTMCNINSEIFGGESEFIENILEPECLLIPQLGVEGACVLYEGGCQRLKDSECSGDFYENYLCSNPDLDTSCEKEFSTGLVEGREEIFWFDSCGNMENIYGTTYNGRIKSKAESCGPNDETGNAGSKTCGNCVQAYGSIAVETKFGETSIADGNFVCKDMNCYDAPINGGGTDDKHHGDTWCIYDSAIGNARASVGSEHYVASCVNGNVEVDACGSARSEICEEKTVEQTSTEISRTFGACVVNQGQMCLSYNEDLEKDPKGVQEKCEANTHCEFKYTDVDDGFKFGACVAKYPQGFDLRPFDEGVSGGEEVQAPDFAQLSCGKATQTCTVYKVRGASIKGGFGTFGAWHDKVNSNCREIDFVEKMNEFCVSMGDCGSNANYVGKTTDNIRVPEVNGNAYKESWAEHFNFAEDAKAVNGQKVEPQSTENILSYMGGSEFGVSPQGRAPLNDDYSKELGIFSGISGSLGSIMAFTPVTAWGGTSYIGVESAILESSTEIALPTLGPIAGALIGAAVGAVVGNQLAKAYGIGGDVAKSMVVAGALAGAGAGTFIAVGVFAAEGTSGLAAASAFAGSTLGIGVIVVAIVAVVYISVVAGFRIGGAGEDKINFYCYPWEAPTEDYDCGLCNENDLIPCTRYKCESLGQGCQILNEGGEENPICVDMSENDVTAPEIVRAEMITDGYKIEKESSLRYKITADNGGMIEEYQDIEFILDTDEYAQCMWSFDKPISYLETEGNYAGGSNRYRLNHTFFIEGLPSIDALDPQFVEGNVDEGFTGVEDIYVVCQDFKGNSNFDPAIIKFTIESEPKITAAVYNSYSPATDSYLAYATTESSMKMWLNRPASCKWSKTKDVAYADMTNAMECSASYIGGREGIKGWPCSTTLTELVPGKNNIFIKCENSQGTINTRDFEYSIFVTENPLEIKTTSPTGELRDNVQPQSLDLELTTIGGAYGGEASCKYISGTQEITFFETNNNYHRQPLNFFGGEHLVPVKCEDDAGNIAEGEINFNLFIDETPPSILRMYLENGYLKIVTNEEAKCYASNEKCNFNVNSSISMSTTFSLGHDVKWNPGETYFIKCEDLFENYNSNCVAEIYPSLFF